RPRRPAPPHAGRGRPDVQRDARACPADREPELEEAAGAGRGAEAPRSRGLGPPKALALVRTGADWVRGEPLSSGFHGVSRRRGRRLPRRRLPDGDPPLAVRPPPGVGPA